MSGASLPQHHPSPRELDDLELLLTGALAPLARFNEPDSVVTLDLPAAVVEAAAGPGAVQLVDPEGLPLARVDLDGTLTPLAHAEYGPFRRLHLSPSAARERYAGRTWIPVAEPLTETQLAAARAAGPCVLLALMGDGTPSLSRVGLVRATLAAAAELPDATVVAVPLAAHGDAEADHHLGVQVVENYADGDPVRGLPEDPDGEWPDAVAEVVDADQPPADRVGLVLFFTGLSGSGKSTLARALVDRILEQGLRTVTSLDGDVVRRHLSAGLTFSAADRETNIRRIGWVAAEIARHGGVAVCSPIAPFASTRDHVRELVAAAGGEFFLIHVATPLEECERRDRKGLYAKARRGEIPEFTGISSPYEVPEAPDVRVDTTGRSVEAALDDVLAELRVRGLLDLPDEPEGADAGAGQDPADEPAQDEPAQHADPDRPEGDGGEPLRVLFVCTANICRSAYLEHRARALVPGGSGVEFASAGTHGLREHPVSTDMRPPLDEAGIDWTGFRSRRLTRDLVGEADLVLTAEADHRSFILELAPESFRKVFTVGQFAETVRDVEPGTPREVLDAAIARRAPARPEHDIADPYGSGPERSLTSARLMDALLDDIVGRLGGGAGSTNSPYSLD